MGDEKNSEDVLQTDLSNENSKVDSDQKENGDTGKTDKVKGKKVFMKSYEY